MTTASLSEPARTNGWYRGSVTVTLSATDPDSTVGASYYSGDGGTTATYSIPFTISSDGIRQLTFYSVEPAGNQEKPNVLTIKIDSTPPVITVAANPTTLWPPNGNIVPVTLSCTVANATSGVNLHIVPFAVTDESGIVHPSGPVTLGANGSYSFVISFRASRLDTDLNGGASTRLSSTLKIIPATGSSSTGVIVPHDQRR